MYSIDIREIDFEKVDSCQSVPTLQRYLRILEQDGGHYTQLETEIKKKITTIDPKLLSKYFPQDARQGVKEDVDDILQWCEGKSRELAREGVLAPTKSREEASHGMEEFEEEEPQIVELPGNYVPSEKKEEEEIEEPGIYSDDEGELLN